MKLSSVYLCTLSIQNGQNDGNNRKNDIIDKVLVSNLTDKYKNESIYASNNIKMIEYNILRRARKVANPIFLYKRCQM